MRILQTGDWHLGRKLNQHPTDPMWAKKREAELWRTAQDVVYLANEKADLLLLCGDIYEKDQFTNEDMLRLIRLLDESRNPVCIIGGNHDPMGKDSLWLNREWPAHVHLLKEGEIVEIDGVKIAGYSWQGPYPPKMSSISDVDVLMLHGDMIEGSLYNIGAKTNLLRMPVKYIALGHIHKAYVIDGKIGCSGSPEPLALSETGDHGVFIIDFESERPYVPIHPIKTAQRTVKDITVRVLNSTTFYEVKKSLQTDDNLETDDLLKLTWKGIDVAEKSLDLWERKLQSMYEFIVFHRDIEESISTDYITQWLEELRALMEEEDETADVIDDVSTIIRDAWGEVNHRD